MVSHICAMTVIMGGLRSVRNTTEGRDHATHGKVCRTECRHWVVTVYSPCDFGILIMKFNQLSSNSLSENLDFLSQSLTKRVQGYHLPFSQMTSLIPQRKFLPVVPISCLFILDQKLCILAGTEKAQHHNDKWYMNSQMLGDLSLMESIQNLF